MGEKVSHHSTLPDQDLPNTNIPKQSELKPMAGGSGDSLTMEGAENFSKIASLITQRHANARRIRDNRMVHARARFRR